MRHFLGYIQQVNARLDRIIQPAGCPGGWPDPGQRDAVLRMHRRRRHAGDQLSTMRRTSSLAPRRLRRVLEHIDEHLGESENMSMARLAGIACLSQNHFATAFKASTGVAPHRYVLRRRIDRAKELLCDERLSLGEIAYLLGFPNQAHFTTMFRKFTGATPGAYRRRL